MRLWLRTLTLWSTLPLCAANRTRSFGCWLNARRHWMMPAPCSALITRSRAVHPWRVAGTCDDVELLREFHIITPGLSGLTTKSSLALALSRGSEDPQLVNTSETAFQLREHPQLGFH